MKIHIHFICKQNTAISKLHVVKYPKVVMRYKIPRIFHFTNYNL